MYPIPKRRFPRPWTIQEVSEAMVIVDGNQMPVAYVYFAENEGRRSASKRMSRDEALKIAKGIVRLPDLLAPPPQPDDAS